MEQSIIVIPAKSRDEIQRITKLKVAAYCRVSTDEEEQETSYEAQIGYYTEKIKNNPEWTLAGIFADEGISGTQAKKRPEFLKMIKLCRIPQETFLLIDSDSACAKQLMIVVSISLSVASVFMPSFSKITGIPSNFSSRM